jgi:hypothetical protein
MNCFLAAQARPTLPSPATAKSRRKTNISWNYRTMLWFLQSIIVSIILIVSAHYVFQYVKNVLAPRKTRDVVNFQLQKYKNMLEEVTSKKAELGEFTAEHYLTYVEDVLNARPSRDTPFMSRPWQVTIHNPKWDLPSITHAWKKSCWK